MHKLLKVNDEKKCFGKFIFVRQKSLFITENKACSISYSLFFLQYSVFWIERKELIEQKWIICLVLMASKYEEFYSLFVLVYAHLKQ